MREMDFCPCVNKGTDQLCSYCTADQRLCFRTLIALTKLLIVYSWYPPGHGDVYASFYNSGLLDKFIKDGKTYMFISNIDNLGATVDISILLNMSQSMGKPAICICENKGADQLRSNCEADQRLCFRYTGSTIPLLSKSKFSSL